MLLFSFSVVSNSVWPHGLQHTRLPCPSPSPRACLNSCPLSWWCRPTISSSVFPFSFLFQSFAASGSFPMTEFFASGGQSGTKTVCHRDSPFFLRTVQALIKAMGKTLNQLSCVSWVSLHRYLLIMSLAFSIFPEDWGLKEQCKWYSIPRTFDTPGVIVDLKMEHRCSEL